MTVDVKGVHLSCCLCFCSLQPCHLVGFKCTAIDPKQAPHGDLECGHSRAS